MNRIADIRSEYIRAELDEDGLAADPQRQFEKWFDEALRSQAAEVNAMVLATVGADGAPDSRVVLYKGHDDAGLFFFTNYESRKGREMERDSRVALVFFWPELERQVRIRGTTQKLSDEDNDRYFVSRPRGSRVGAWASNQSEPILNRDALAHRFATTEARFGDGEVERPAHWGGYRVLPNVVEFWQGRANRMHDRIEYFRVGDGWSMQRLMP